MSKFSEFYGKHLFKQSAGQRLTAIDFLINEIDSQMQAVVDPTRWRHLLDEKQRLDEERKEIVSRQGEFKMA